MLMSVIVMISMMIIVAAMMMTMTMMTMVTAMMMVTDPEQVRYQQRVEAGLAYINGVAITPLADTIQLGQEMIQFRARYTAEAIRRALSTAN